MIWWDKGLCIKENSELKYLLSIVYNSGFPFPWEVIICLQLVFDPEINLRQVGESQGLTEASHFLSLLLVFLFPLISPQLLLFSIFLLFFHIPTNLLLPSSVPIFNFPMFIFSSKATFPQEKFGWVELGPVELWLVSEPSPVQFFCSCWHFWKRDKGEVLLPYCRPPPPQGLLILS